MEGLVDIFLDSLLVVVEPSKLIYPSYLVSFFFPRYFVVVLDASIKNDESSHRNERVFNYIPGIHQRNFPLSSCNIFFFSRFF